MRTRWRYFSHIAQASEAPNSDYRPNGEVYVARGLFRMHNFPDYPRELDPAERRNSEILYRGDWDEKYSWYGQPGEENLFSMDPTTGEQVYGGPLIEELVGMVKLPYVKEINIRDSLDQNGIATATITIGNIEMGEVTTNPEMVYHFLREGFFSPFYAGEEVGFSDSESESAGPGMIYNDDGKRMTGLLLPNRHIDVFQGYGDELQRTFTGLIDSVDIQSSPPQITLNCSNFGRIMTEQAFFKKPGSKLPYPIAFGDAAYWIEAESNKKRPHFPPAKLILVDDITDVTGHILGWGGFQYFKSPRPGRIGSIELSTDVKDWEMHNAILSPDAFDKGTPMIEGVNFMKQLLGYQFYITPEFAQPLTNTGDQIDDERYMTERFRDPSVYDPEYSRFTIGLPHFVPSNIWLREPTVEQFSDHSVILDSQLTYDGSSLRKNIYVVNWDLADSTAPPKAMGMSAPWELERGIGKHIYYDMREEMGGMANFTEKEVQIFMMMTLIQTIIAFCRGSFTIPGYPGAKLNDQCDFYDSTSETWRRMFISGYESNMTLGPNSTYKTTLTVANIDNMYIRRLKRRILSLGGFKLALTYQGDIRRTSVNKNEH